jgi:DNA-binding TFAR19-related protein (PDSD5 family)
LSRNSKSQPRHNKPQPTARLKGACRCEATDFALRTNITNQVLCMNYDGINPQDLNQLAQMKQVEEMKRQLMSRLLTKEAFERLGRVRSVNPQLAAQAELYLLQAYQAGQLRGTVDDAKLREILQALSEKKDFNIKRK